MNQAATELMPALGLQEHLVGTAESLYPEEFKAVAADPRLQDRYETARR